MSLRRAQQNATNDRMRLLEIAFNIALMVVLPAYLGASGFAFLDLLFYACLTGVLIVVSEDPRYVIQLRRRAEVRNYFVVRIASSIVVAVVPFVLGRALS